MKTVPFGNTGYTVSVLGFGSAPIGYLNAGQDKATEILSLMLDAGVNLIDTAASYPGSEQMIGNAVGHRRGDLVIVSKCGSKLPDVDAKNWTPEMIDRTIDRSLKNLGTDYLDVMLLHSCGLTQLKENGVIEALAAAKKAGKIRFAGYSGDNDAAVYAAGHEDISVIETSVNITDQKNIDTVLPICRARNLGVLAKRPIANAAWKDVEQQQGLYKSYAKTYSDRLAKMGLKPDELGFTPADWPSVALRFTLAQAGVHSAIIGTQNPANARANLAYTDQPPLSPDVVAKIHNAFKAADDGTWTGQT